MIPFKNVIENALETIGKLKNLCFWYVIKNNVIPQNWTDIDVNKNLGAAT